MVQAAPSLPAAPPRPRATSGSARTAVASLVLPLVLVGACGGGGDDEAEIRTILEDRRTDPASICDHMTSELLEQLGGKERCRELAVAEDNQDPDAKVVDVDVDGERATARLTGQDGRATVAFRKEDGEWRAAAP